MHHKISICGPGKRPEYWMRFYNSLGLNDVEFEVIFAGPNYPTGYDAPKNLHHLPTNVKPAQCMEAAVRASDGDYLMFMGDDYVFTTERPLDRLLAQTSPMEVVSAHSLVNGEDRSAWCHRLYVEDQNSPFLPVAGLLNHDIFDKLGGFDNNFIAVMWDIDLMMRFYEIGGKASLIHDVSINEVIPGGTRSYPTEIWEHDRGYVEGLWGQWKLHNNRSKPFKLSDRYEDKDILTISQGKTSPLWN